MVLTVVLTWKDVDLRSQPPIQFEEKKKSKEEDEEESVWEPLGLPDAVTYPDEINHQDLSAWDLRYEWWLRYRLIWESLLTDKKILPHAEENAEFLVSAEYVKKPKDPPAKALYKEWMVSDPSWKWIPIKMKIGMTEPCFVDFPVKAETNICKDCARPLEMFERPMMFDHKGGLCDLCVRRREWRKEWESEKEANRSHNVPLEMHLQSCEQTMLAEWRRKSREWWDLHREKNSNLFRYWSLRRELPFWK